MKAFALLFLTALLLMTIGCGEIPAQEKKYGSHQLFEAVPVQGQSKKPQVDEITIHTVTDDNTGQPVMYIPFPSSWKIHGQANLGETAITGPHGMTSILYPAESYIYTNDPMLNSGYQSGGIQVVAPVGVQNTLNQVVLPQGQHMGMTYLSQYTLPKVAAKDREYFAKLNGGDAPQNIFEVIGTEWKDREGNLALIMLHYNETRSYNVVTWGYSVEMIKAQPSGFEQAKRQYLYAMANRIYDENAVRAFQSALAADLKRQADHADKIRTTIATHSAARLKADAETTKYVTNSNQATAEFRAHNDDLRQQQVNHALTDISVVVSPFDGKEYEVEAGTKTYWINDEGKYLKSDDPLFDPNKFEERLDVWKKAPMKVYK